MKNKKLIIVGVVALLLIVIGLYLRSGSTGSFTPSQEVSTAEPIDIVADFYQTWLSALQSTTTDPLAAELANNPLLSPALRERIAAPAPAEGFAEGMIDQVICQTVVPERVNAKTLYVYPGEKAQVLMFTKGSDQTGQAIVTLLAQNDGWYIDDILCSRGEFDVPREFTFDTEGFLLKQVPPPYEAGKWHLVFEQDGQQGFVAPLLFGSTSMCTPLGSETESLCTPDQYEEAKKVYVQGQMTELGAEIQHMKFLE